jgi:hypothetical protein
MSRNRIVCRTSLIAVVTLALMGGCSATSAPGMESTRRGLERDFISSPEYGSARGRAFEDIIPVGARITAVHVTHGSGVKGIWLSYERNGVERQTQLRGARAGSTDVFKLARNEMIVGIDAWGQGTIEGLTIASNKQTKSFGTPRPESSAGKQPWHVTLIREDGQRYVGIGITGRADSELRQLSLRLQVRSEDS